MQFSEYVKYGAGNQSSRGSIPSVTDDDETLSRQDPGPSLSKKPSKDRSAPGRWDGYTPAQRRREAQANTAWNRRFRVKFDDNAEYTREEIAPLTDEQERELQEEISVADSERLRRRREIEIELMYEEQQFNDMYEDIDYGDGQMTMNAVAVPTLESTPEEDFSHILEEVEYHHATLGGVLNAEREMCRIPTNTLSIQDQISTTEDRQSNTEDDTSEEEFSEHIYVRKKFLRNNCNKKPLFGRMKRQSEIPPDILNFKVKVNKKSTLRPEITYDQYEKFMRLPVVCDGRILYAPQGVGKTTITRYLTSNGISSVEVQQLPPKYRNNIGLKNLADRGFIVMTNRLRDTEVCNTRYVMPTRSRFIATTMVRSLKTFEDVCNDYHRLNVAIPDELKIHLPDDYHLDSVINREFRLIPIPALYYYLSKGLDPYEYVKTYQPSIEYTNDALNS